MQKIDFAKKSCPFVVKGSSSEHVPYLCNAFSIQSAYLAAPAACSLELQNLLF